MEGAAGGLCGIGRDIRAPDRLGGTEQAEQERVVEAANLEQMPTTVWNRNLVLGFIVGVVVGLVEYGYIGLYATFLIKYLHFAPTVAGLAFSRFGLGGMVAGIPAGYLGDRFRQKWVLVVGFVLSAAVSYGLFNVAHTAGGQIVLSFFKGAFTASWLYVNGYSLMQRSVRPQWVGKASGLYVTAAYLPAAAGYIFARLVGMVGWGGAGLIQLTLLPVIGIVAVLFIDDRRLLRVR